MTKTGFVYIWEYRVKPECVNEFKKFYGPDGDWVQLFRKADGYVKTDLHQDFSDKCRFITVDFWETKQYRDHFRVKFAEEFMILDAHCEGFTSTEKLIGDFDSLLSQY